MTNMFALQIRQEGNDVVSGVFECAKPTPADNELLIEVCYSSVNYKDALAATGKGKLVREFPRIGGIDAVGYVVASYSKDFREGDAVLVTGYDLGTSHDGGYAEFICVPAAWAVPLPAKMSMYDAMALGTAGFTAALCIKRLRDNNQTPEHGNFLVTGSAGGVGSLCIDILTKLGYSVYAMTRKQSNHDYLAALGAVDIIDTTSILHQNNPALQKAIWGGAIDNVGDKILHYICSSVKPWGNVCSVGLAAGSDFPTTVMPFILRGVSLLGVSSSNCPAVWRSALWQQLSDELAPVHLNKIVQNTLKLEQLNDYFVRMLAGEIIGRAVVAINAPK